MLLLDGVRIEPDCTVARLEAIQAAQRPLGRAPRIILEYDKRHSRAGWNGEVRDGNGRPIQSLEGLGAPLACTNRCGFYGASWWRGLCSGCFLNEKAQGSATDDYAQWLRKASHTCKNGMQGSAPEGDPHLSLIHI